VPALAEKWKFRGGWCGLEVKGRWMVQREGGEVKERKVKQE
jgi:hypothetical protein